MIAPVPGALPRTARVLTVGSCFADSLGNRLTENKVTTLANPFGTVFQPLAAAQLLRAAAGEDVDWQQHVIEARGRWQSLDLHSSIGADSPVELLQMIGEKVYNAGTFLRQADVVVLTLGTAWAYRNLSSGELVSNCHKLAADLFEKVLLTPDEIINALAETHAYLRRLNPKLRFVLTVSPVRHLKDTLPLNAVSKSVLRVACHYLSELLPDVSYFPAFELLTDDLRDYRFYGADMLHPTETAEDYVWDKFARTYFDADFGRFRKEWATVRQALAHRPLYAGAPEHRQFLDSTRERLEKLAAQGVAVGYELADVQERLAALPEPVRALEMVEAVEDDGEERIDSGPTEATTTNEMPEAAIAPASVPNYERELRPSRGRGRGRGRREQANDVALTAASVAENIDFEVIVTEKSAMAEAAAVPTLALVSSAADATAALDVTDGPDEAVKKKKRRSRGGAKRTARKNAALAADAAAQQGGESSPKNAEAAHKTADEAAHMATDLPAVSDQRRQSVITKSVPVKRGGRNRRGGGGRGENTPGETVTTNDLAASAAQANATPTTEIQPEALPTINETVLTSAQAPRQTRGQQPPLYAMQSAQKLMVTAPEVIIPKAPATLAEQVLGLTLKSQLSVAEMYETRRAADKKPRRQNAPRKGSAAPAVETSPVAPVVTQTDAEVSDTTRLIAPVAFAEEATTIQPVATEKPKSKPAAAKTRAAKTKPTPAAVAAPKPAPTTKTKKQPAPAPRKPIETAAVTPAVVAETPLPAVAAKPEGKPKTAAPASKSAAKKPPKPITKTPKDKDTLAAVETEKPAEQPVVKKKVARKPSAKIK